MTRPPGRNTFDSANTRYSLARILAILATGPKTYKQVCDTLHMSDRSARRYLRHLRDEPNRRVRVRRYVQVPFGSTPLFELGNAPDVKKCKQTAKQKAAKWRARIKASPELQDKLRRESAARWAREKAMRAPSTWFSALGGAV